MTLNLNVPDFTTASRVSERINREIGSGTAAALDATSVRVRAPVETEQRIAFVSMLESLSRSIQAQLRPG